MRHNYICTKSIGAKNNCESGRREICSQHSAERGGNTWQKLKSSMTVSEARWRRGNWRPSGDLGFINTSARHQSKITILVVFLKSCRRHVFERSPNSPLSPSKSPNKQSTFFRTRVMRKEQVTRIYITDCREMGKWENQTPMQIYLTFLESTDRVPGGEVVYSSMKYWTKGKSASENPR